MKIRNHVIFCFSWFYIKVRINFEVVLGYVLESMMGRWGMCWSLWWADGVYFFKGCFQDPVQPWTPVSSEAESAHWGHDGAEISLPAWLPGIPGRQQPLADVSLGEYSPFPLSLSQKKTCSSVTANKGRSVFCAVHQRCCLLNPAGSLQDPPHVCPLC